MRRGEAERALSQESDPGSESCRRHPGRAIERLSSGLCTCHGLTFFFPVRSSAERPGPPPAWAHPVVAPTGLCKQLFIVCLRECLPMTSGPASDLTQSVGPGQGACQSLSRSSLVSAALPASVLMPPAVPPAERMPESNESSKPG